MLAATPTGVSVASRLRSVEATGLAGHIACSEASGHLRSDEHLHFDNVQRTPVNHPIERLAGNLSLSIEGVEPRALIPRLNGVASETFGDVARTCRTFRVSPGRFKAAEKMKTFGERLVKAVGALPRIAARAYLVG